MRERAPLLQPRPGPPFAVRLRPWLGRGIYKAATADGARTPTGYRCHLRVADSAGQFGRFSKWTHSDLRKREFLGFALCLTDLDTTDGPRPKRSFLPMQKTRHAHDRYGNTLGIVDLKGQLKGDSVITAHLAPLLP